jgi:Flp pilus assembly protein TadG
MRGGCPREDQRRRRDDGTGLVEFALILPVLLILLVGIFDVALASWQSNTLTAAAREGTRYAITHGAESSDPAGPGDDAAVIDVVRRHAVGLQNVTVTATWPDALSTSIAASAAAGQDIVEVASTTGFAVGGTVFVAGGANREQHSVRAVLASPARLQLSAKLTNSYASGTVEGGKGRGSRVKVVATADYAPVLSQAFLGNALRVTLTGGSELVIHR